MPTGHAFAIGAVMHDSGLTVQLPWALAVNAITASHRPTNIFFISLPFLLLIRGASCAALAFLLSRLSTRLLIRADQVVVFVALRSLTVRAAAVIVNTVRHSTSRGRPMPAVPASTRDWLAHAQLGGDSAGDLRLLHGVLPLTLLRTADARPVIRCGDTRAG
ncbi:hypothetical protein QPK29_021440 [Massilia sp. YIM B02787]|uniref:Uncharacterized protein n=1 Tax=Massilia orientalis TaxID=3050128 RepID=A0ACC7MIT0_9BURK|nr:hypothetical protein [Massilia sp. YIM B02787]